MKIYEIKVCLSCKKEFPIQKKERHHKFCSPACARTISLPKMMAVGRMPKVRAKAIALSKEAWHGQNLMGRRFGKLVVISRAEPTTDKAGNKMWIVQCDCGRKIIRATADLNSRARHCGCSFPKGIKSANWLGYGDMSGSHLSYIRKTAKKARIPFNLTCQGLWELYQKQKGLCALSGTPILIMKVSFSRKNSIEAASLDRINPRLGYTMDNVQWTSLAYNFMKREHLQKEFLNMCNKVTEYQRNKEAKEEEKTILATVVGERPANVPEEVGVFIVEGGEVKS